MGQNALSLATPLHFASLGPPRVRPAAELSVDLARSRVDRQRALELHRDVYWRKGLLAQNSPGLWRLPQASAPGSATLVAKDRGEIVATISFSMDSAIGLPMDSVHSEEINELRSRFTRIAEVGSLAVLENYRGLGIPLALYRGALRWAVATQTHCIVACVNPSSRRFYSKLLLFDVLGECKQHPRFRGAPSIPIALSLTAGAEVRGAASCY